MKRLVKLILVLGGIAALLAVGNRVYLRAAYPRKYSEFVEQSCAEYGVPQSLAYAVIQCESGFDPAAESSVGARGLMQIMPGAFDWLQSKMPDRGEPLDADALWDPQVNVRYGVFLLHLHLEEFGDVGTAIAAYHAGRGSVNGWLKDPALAPDGKTLTDIPYPDTKAYADKVQKTMQIYQKLYG